MKKILLSFFVLSFVFSNAQNTFQKVFSLNNIITTSGCSDGGAITIGNDGYPVVMKTSNAGQVQWSKVFTQNFYPFAIIEAPTGGYDLMSEGSDSLSSGVTITIVHLDNSGNITWNKTFVCPNVGTYDPPKMHVEQNGAILIAVSIYDRISLIRLDNNGNLVWTGAYTSDINEPKNPGFDATICSDGGILATAKASSDIFLVKLSISGQVQWTKRFDNYSYDHPNCVIQTADGNNIIAGYDEDYNSSVQLAYMMKVDNSGNVIWFKTYDPLTSFDRIMQMANGDLVLLQLDFGNFTCILVTDQNGIPITSKKVLANSYYASSLDMSKTNSDDIYLAGSIFDMNTNYYSFVYRSSGISMPWCDVRDTIVNMVNVNYNPIVTANTFAQMPVFTSFTPLVIANSNVSITSFDYCVNSGIGTRSIADQVNIFPNPISTTATIQVDASLINENTQFILYDMLGKEVMKQKITSEKTQISRGDLNAGIYLYKIVSGSGIINVGKLILSEK